MLLLTYDSEEIYIAILEGTTVDRSVIASVVGASSAGHRRLAGVLSKWALFCLLVSIDFLSLVEKQPKELQMTIRAPPPVVPPDRPPGGAVRRRLRTVDLAEDRMREQAWIYRVEGFFVEWQLAVATRTSQ